MWKLESLFSPPNKFPLLRTAKFLNLKARWLRSPNYMQICHTNVWLKNLTSNPRFETTQFITSCRPRHTQLKKYSFPKFVSANRLISPLKIPNLTHTIRKLISYFSIEIVDVFKPQRFFCRNTPKLLFTFRSFFPGDVTTHQKFYGQKKWFRLVSVD